MVAEASLSAMNLQWIRWLNIKIHLETFFIEKLVFPQYSASPKSKGITMLKLVLAAFLFSVSTPAFACPAINGHFSRKSEDGKFYYTTVGVVRFQGESHLVIGGNGDFSVELSGKEIRTVGKNPAATFYRGVCNGNKISLDARTEDGHTIQLSYELFDNDSLELRLVMDGQVNEYTGIYQRR